jgi:hypothetical protein
MNRIKNESPKETITDRHAHLECPSLFNHRPVDPGKSGECLIVERLLFQPYVVVCRFPLSLHDMSKKHMLNCLRMPHRAVRRLRLGYWSFWAALVACFWKRRILSAFDLRLLRLRNRRTQYATLADDRRLGKRLLCVGSSGSRRGQISGRVGLEKRFCARYCA